MLSFYVAGSSTESGIKVCREAMDKLEVRGGFNTLDWTVEAERYNQASAEERLFWDVSAAAGNDLSAVARADVFLLMADSSSRGALVELGVALALGKKVAICNVGSSGNIFYHAPGVVRFQTLQPALAWFERLK